MAYKKQLVGLDMNGNNIKGVGAFEGSFSIKNSGGVITLTATNKASKPTYLIYCDDDDVGNYHEWMIPDEAEATFASREWVERQGFLTSYTEKYTGTVKSVNNVQPDASGNVTIATGGGGNGTVNVTERGSDEYEDFWLVGVKQPSGNNQAVKSICERDPSDPSDIIYGAYWNRYNGWLKVLGDVNCVNLIAVGVDAQNVDQLVARLASTSDKFFLHPNALATNSGYKGNARVGYFYEVVEGSTSGFSITYCSSSSASTTTTVSNVHIAYVRTNSSTTTATSSFCIIAYMDNSMTWKTITCYVRSSVNTSCISGACKVRQKTNTY